MRFGAIRDRERIEHFLRRETNAHVYALADLDDVFWNDTRWFAAFDGDDVTAICLLLDGLALPILYAICPENHEPTRALLAAIRGELPERLFYNLGPGLVSCLRGEWQIAPEGTYWKMSLADRTACQEVSPEGVFALGPADHAELRAFLDNDAYLPDETGGLFFEPRMLASGCYRGIREHDRLVAVGGVHVYSRRYGVAALGNVATRMSRRGHGLARRISAAVTRSLLAEIETIGLNVHETNEPAIRCYRRLGFEPVCPYEEGVAWRV
jgi:ribosomal protein S18 acetylase RimI-like enzyme